MGFLDATGITTLVNKLKTKFQETLVSGTNIKTVGGNSLLGSGNISFPSVPTASTTAPSMDGTASYGSGTSYARSNHVHPTDTSRQEVLVSGTNIKTINNESILGSGNISIGGGGGGTVTLSDCSSSIEEIINRASEEISAEWGLILQDMATYGEATVDLNAFATLIAMSIGELYYYICS